MPNEKKGRLHFPKEHKKVYFIILIIIVGLAIYFWPRPPKSIETQKVKRQDIVESLSATGSVDSQTSVDLKFPISGKLIYLGIKKGDMVKAGQIIAVLDQRTVQKNLEDDLRDYSKQRNSFDQTQTNNQNRSPEQSLNDDMKRILQNNQYNLEKAVLSVELQDLAKQQTVLISPIDGIVTNSGVSSTGINILTTTSFTITDPAHLIFKIDIDEADIGKVKIGQKVKLTLDAYQDKDIYLSVKTIDFASHTNTTGGNVYTVEVSLPENNNSIYRVGMNGDAEIITNERKNVLSIPLSSSVEDKYVFVLSNNVFKKRSVNIGLRNDTDAEIISGLAQDEIVAMDPAKAQNLIKNQ